MPNKRLERRRLRRRFVSPRVAAFVMAAAVAAWAVTGTAQSPNPFGTPSADKPSPDADATTLGTAAFVRFAGLEDLDLLAVAGAPSQAVLQPFLDHGVSISTARGRENV